MTQIGADTRIQKPRLEERWLSHASAMDQIEARIYGGTVSSWDWTLE